jgi:very-short-patch-repair endonuclease
MPSGRYKRTDEHRMKISLSAKNNPNFGMKGKKVSLESRKIISKAQKKRFENESAWNKGLKGFNKGHPYYGGEKGQFKKGHLDLVPKESRGHTEETKQKIRIARAKQVITKEHKKNISLGLNGHKVSDETKRKIVEARRRNNSYNHSEQVIIKIKEARAKQVIPIQDTSIEVKIQGFLTLLKIEYIAHKYLSEIENKYCCDILIPSVKTIIECDGDYFHANPKFYSNDKLNQRQIEQKERDNLRTKELEEKGYRVIRLWEHEIKRMELNDFKSIIDI